jgi:hypothetical protein
MAELKASDSGVYSETLLLLLVISMLRTLLVLIETPIFDEISLFLSSLLVSSLSVVDAWNI